MSKILVIGVGSAGRETVKHMKDTGIPEADYITFGNFENDERKDIPHYNLITMNGFDGLSPSRDPNRSKRLAENVEDDKEYYTKLADYGEYSKMMIEAVQANWDKPHPLYLQVLKELKQIYGILENQSKINEMLLLIQKVERDS